LTLDEKVDLLMAEYEELLDKTTSNGEVTHFSEQKHATQYFSAMSEREDGANADDLSSSEQFFSAMPEREDETYSTPSEPSGPVYTDHLTDSRKVPEQISAL